MPNFLAHSFIGFICGVIVAFYLQFSLIEIFMCGLISFIFSAIPDIDHSNSKARKVYRKILYALLPIISFYIFYIHLKINLLYSLVISVLFSPVLIFLSEKFIPKHRTLTHTFTFSVLISLIFMIFLYVNNITNFVVYSICALLGIFSHLILDKLF